MIINLLTFLIFVDDSWQSVLTIVDFYGDNSDNFAAVAAPGQWNDPDMVGILLDMVGIL